jgi:hypothetical protein
MSRKVKRQNPKAEIKRAFDAKCGDFGGKAEEYLDLISL